MHWCSCCTGEASRYKNLLNKSICEFLRFLTLLALPLAILQVSPVRCHGPELEVLNEAGTTRGGQAYLANVGDLRAQQMLKMAVSFTTELLQVETRGKRKIALIISTLPEDETASTTTIDDMSVIEISQQHLARVEEQGDVSRELEGLTYEQMAYAWMNGIGVAPAGLTEGIAKFVRLEAGLAPENQFEPDQFVTGTPSPWDNGTYATAHFLRYLQIAYEPNFVALLNHKMADGWSDKYTREVLGGIDSVEQVWQEWSLAPHPSPVDRAPLTGGAAIAGNIPCFLALVLLSAATF